jgi:hypothetical protein
MRITRLAAASSHNHSSFPRTSGHTLRRALAISWPTIATTRGRSRPTSGTEYSEYHALFRAGSAEFQESFTSSSASTAKTDLLVNFCSQRSKSGASLPMYRRIDFLDGAPSFVVRFK